jgi:tryptophan synthase alpha chain
MEDTLATAAEFRRRHDVPLILMGYANPVLRFGPSNFFDAAHSSGVQGIILPDVPPEEADPFLEEAARTDLDMIMLVSPTTPDDRIRRIDEVSSGFVYAVSVTGVTGTSLGAADQISAYLDRVRALLTVNPLMVGFGIRDRDAVERLGRSADGCIVGSALIDLIDECRDAGNAAACPDRVTEFVHTLKYGSPSG